VPGAETRYAAFDRPLRAYAAVDDPIAPPRAVGELLRHFRSAVVERVDLAPSQVGVPALGHVGLLRPGAEKVWTEFLEFGTRHARGA
jgi:predicted alpha/beta hydrolase